MTKHLRRALTGLLAVVLAHGVLLAVEPAATADRALNARAAYDWQATCKRPARGFKPTHASIVALAHTYKVVQVKRTRDNQVGAGPISDTGKHLVAMDPHNRPNSGSGSVLLSAHTYPDGSALGNAMLKNVQEGDDIILRGKDGKVACYRVWKRDSYPADEVPYKKAFRQSGPEQLVFVVCSGKRVGPGHWLRRTLWYAVPLVPRPPAPPSTPDPGDDGGSDGGLLGGLIGGLLG